MRSSKLFPSDLCKLFRKIHISIHICLIFVPFQSYFYYFYLLWQWVISSKNNIDSFEFEVLSDYFRRFAYIHKRVVFFVHPYAHKLAGFQCYIHRLLNTSLSIEDYSSELNIIKQIAVNNVCQANHIDNMIEKKIIKTSIAISLSWVHTLNSKKSMLFFELITHCQSALKIIKVLKKDKNQAYMSWHVDLVKKFT